MASSPQFVSFRRLRNAEHLLPHDAPLCFRRTLPTGDPELHALGITVEVHIHPDLRIFVLTQPEREIGLTGRWGFGDVMWDQQPSELFPVTAHAMLTADIRDMLRLFRMREIHPRAWTSRTDALEQL